MTVIKEYESDGQVDPGAGGPLDVPIRELLGEEVLDLLLERSRDGAGQLRLTGENSMLGRLVKAVLERALEAELTAHLGYAKHTPGASKQTGNARNGKGRPKTVQTGVGPVRIDVPRDRAGSFEPMVVPKRVCRGFRSGVTGGLRGHPRVQGWQREGVEATMRSRDDRHRRSPGVCPPSTDGAGHRRGQGALVQFPTDSSKFFIKTAVSTGGHFATTRAPGAVVALPATGPGVTQGLWTYDAATQHLTDTTTGLCADIKFGSSVNTIVGNPFDTASPTQRWARTNDNHILSATTDGQQGGGRVGWLGCNNGSNFRWTPRYLSIDPVAWESSNGQDMQFFLVKQNTLATS
jgi:mutator family transposase